MKFLTTTEVPPGTLGLATVRVTTKMHWITAWLWDGESWLRRPWTTRTQESRVVHSYYTPELTDPFEQVAFPSSWRVSKVKWEWSELERYKEEKGL